MWRPELFLEKHFKIDFGRFESEDLKSWSEFREMRRHVGVVIVKIHLADYA